MEFGESVFPEAEEREIAIKSGKKWRPIDRYKAIVSNRGQVYAIVSKNYKLIQHREVAEITDKVIREFNIKPIATRLVFSLDGAVMFYKILLNETVINDERLKFGIMVTNSYDLSVGVNILGFGMNMFCMNQMVFGSEFLKIKKRHLEGSVGLELEKFKKAVEEILDALTQVEDIIKASMRSKITFREVVDLILGLRLSLRNTRKVLGLIRKYAKLDYNLLAEAVMDKEKREKHIEGVGNLEVATRWQVYNALTDFITHHLRTKDMSKELEMHNKAVKVLAKVR